MIVDFLTVNLKNALNDEIGRAQSAETALKIESFAGAEYDSSATTINFYNGFGDKIAEIDATDFVVDGMIENVTLSGNILTITFNTAAGKEDIEIDLSEFINPENYYTKTEIDTTISGLCQDIEQSFSAVTEDINTLSANVETAIADFVTSAQVETQIVNKGYATSGDVNTLSGNIDTRISEVERVTSSGYNELHTDIVALSGQAENFITSGAIQNFVTSAQVETQITGKNYVTSGDVQTQITSAMTDSVYSTTIHNIVSISQADYDLLPVKDPNTLYVIIS